MFVHSDTLWSLLPPSLATPLSLSLSLPLSPPSLSTEIWVYSALLFPHSPGRHLQRPIVENKKDFTFRWLTNFKFSEVNIKFPWQRKAYNVTESRKFVYRNKILNLSIRMPNWFSKHRVFAIAWSCHVWRDTGKSERVEAQKCFLTATGPADLASVRLQWRPLNSWSRRRD